MHNPASIHSMLAVYTFLQSLPQSTQRDVAMSEARWVLIEEFGLSAFDNRIS